MNFHQSHSKTTDAALWHIRQYPVFAIDAKSVEKPIETGTKTHHQQEVAPKFVRHRSPSSLSAGTRELPTSRPYTLSSGHSVTRKTCYTRVRAAAAHFESYLDLVPD